MGFMYFAPCELAQVDEWKQKVSYAFDSVGTPTTQSPTGPGGVCGVIIGDAGAWAGNEPRLFHVPDTQTWVELPGTDGMYVGWYELPTPDQLARPKQLRGRGVELADGNEWLIPLARYFVECGSDYGFTCALPSAASYDGEKWSESGPVAKYQPLWDIALRWLEEMTPEEDGTATVQDDCNDCVSVLGFNYRLGPIECSVLKLLTADARGEIVATVLDIHTFLEWSKKNETAAGMSS